jgi:hypothetical protein
LIILRLFDWLRPKTQSHVVGTGVLYQEAALLFSYCVRVSLSDCVFENCSGVNGGAINILDAEIAQLVGCSFSGNVAVLGSSLYCTGTAVMVGSICGC